MQKNSRRVKDAWMKDNMEEVKVEFYKDKPMSEEYQVTGFHYAFLSENNKMCHPWIKCRDFLQDALRNQLTGRNDQIYSFTYKPGSDPEIDTVNTRMMVKRIPHPVTDEQLKEFEEMMTHALELIRHYEDTSDMTPKTELIKVADDSIHPYLFVGPGEWSQSSVLISLYTFLIRLGYKKIAFKNGEELANAYVKLIEDKENQTNDTRYLKLVHNHIYNVLKSRGETMFKQKDGEIMFQDTPMSNFHHNSGIVSLCGFRTPDTKLNSKFKSILTGKEDS